MTVTTIAGVDVQVDAEGFMTDPSEWTPGLAMELAQLIGIDELKDDHWAVIDFLRHDYEDVGQTATLRRVTAGTGLSPKDLFRLFPKKPSKKMAYIAGLPKPAGCV